jgi:hypothetical protein
VSRLKRARVAAAATADDLQDTEHLGGQLDSSLSTKPKRRQAIDCSNHLLTVFDGANRVGSLVERDGGRFEAYDTTGTLIGIFDGMRAAMRALPNREVSSC